MDKKADKKSRRHDSDPVLAEYTRLAPDYDRKWSFYIQASVQETLARLRLNKGERILDIGCGTGVLLHALNSTDPTLQLAGIDPVAEMLAIARTRLNDKVTLKLSWAEQLPFEGASFDKVVSCSMFHYIRQPQQALAEIKRVLAPGGELVITDWCDDYLSCKVCDFYLRLFNKAHNKTWGLEGIREILADSAFEQITAERYRINWLWGLMTARAYID